jgi:ribosomal protein S27AE
MQATIEQQRMREYERFEYQRRMTDEITDMSERLAAPMRNTFEYALREDGELWFQGEPLSPIFDRGITVAEELTRTSPQFATELVRRRLERQEYDEVRKLALGGDEDPEVLLVMSPIPDAALAGTSFNAYDLDRKKTLVRVFQRTSNGVSATSLSLDLSDRDGLNSVASLFGKTIPPEAGSEDILAMRFWGYEDEFETSTVNTVRSVYDAALSEKFGGEWYAGRRSSRITDAKQFIEQQQDLIDQHMQVIARLKAKLDGNELEKHLESARYNLAAALSRRLRGEKDAGSLADAGDVARANGERYDNDCPTGITAEQSKSELYNEERWMTCPFCGLATYGDPCAARLICGKCAAEVRDGKVVSKGIGRAKALGLVRSNTAKQERLRTQEKTHTPTKLAIARRAFGETAQVRHHVGVGTSYFVAYDRLTGKDIGKI